MLSENLVLFKYSIWNYMFDVVYHQINTNLIEKLNLVFKMSLGKYLCILNLRLNPRKNPANSIPKPAQTQKIQKEGRPIPLWTRRIAVWSSGTCPSSK